MVFIPSHLSTSVQRYRDFKKDYTFQVGLIVRLLVFINERYIYTSKSDDAPHSRGVIGLHNP